MLRRRRTRRGMNRCRQQSAIYAWRTPKSTTHILGPIEISDGKIAAQTLGVGIALESSSEDVNGGLELPRLCIRLAQCQRCFRLIRLNGKGRFQWSKRLLGFSQFQMSYSSKDVRRQ